MSRDDISDVASSRLAVEPAELSEIAENREIFRTLLGMLPRNSHPRGKSAVKMNEQFVYFV